jgi:hypothetical protein
MSRGKEIHFYPKDSLMVVLSLGKHAGVPLYVIDARGGPPTRGHDPRMAEIPTTSGRYIIGDIRAYRTKTWSWSQIAWGTPLRDAAAANDVLCQTHPGKWQSITTQYGISRIEIMNAYYDLWGRLEVPPTWVFNDFGPIAIRYFKDKNANGVRDRGEPLSGEMIHTTPEDEAATGQNVSFSLAESHGCIHIRPADRDKLVHAGVFKVGTPLIIHRYTESCPYAHAATP